MNSAVAGMAFCLFFSAFLLSGCAMPLFLEAGSEAGQVRAHFDGYEWSWHCWNDENKFTLWKEHITRVGKVGDFWVVEGVSSDRGNLFKAASSDETGRILIVYDKENGKVVGWVHGDYQNVSVGPDGNITGMVSTYC